MNNLSTALQVAQAILFGAFLFNVARLILSLTIKTK